MRVLLFKTRTCKNDLFGHLKKNILSVDVCLFRRERPGFWIPEPHQAFSFVCQDGLGGNVCVSGPKEQPILTLVPQGRSSSVRSLEKLAM